MFSFLKKDTVESVREKLYKMYQKGITLFPEEYFCLYLWYREEPLLDLAMQAKHARALRFMHQQTGDINYLRMAADEGCSEAGRLLCEHYWENADYTNYWKYITKSYGGTFFTRNDQFAQAYREGLGVEINQDIAAFFECLQNPASYTTQDAERLQQIALSADNWYVRFRAIDLLQYSNMEEYGIQLARLAEQGNPLIRELLIWNQLYSENSLLIPNKFKNYNQEFQAASYNLRAYMYQKGYVPESEEVLQVLLKRLEDYNVLTSRQTIEVDLETYSPEEYATACEELGGEPEEELVCEIPISCRPEDDGAIDEETGQVIVYDITLSDHHDYANMAADVLEKLGYDSTHAKFYRLFATHWEMTAF